MLPWSHRDDTNGTAYNTMAQRTAQQQYHGTAYRTTKALDNHFGDGVMPTHHEGHSVMLSMVSIGEADESTPRNLTLWVKPNPRNDESPLYPEIYLVNKEDKWEIEGTGLGRLVQLSEMDFVLALFWNRVCRMGYGHHKDYPEETHFRVLPPNFRLIDTKRMCVVNVPTNSSLDYVTLSYVWGTAKQFKL